MTSAYQAEGGPFALHDTERTLHAVPDLPETAAETRRFAFAFPEDGGVVVDSMTVATENGENLGALETALIRKIIAAPEARLTYFDLIKDQDLRAHQPEGNFARFLNAAIGNVREAFDNHELPFVQQEIDVRGRKRVVLQFIGGVAYEHTPSDEPLIALAPEPLPEPENETAIQPESPVAARPTPKSPTSIAGAVPKDVPAHLPQQQTKEKKVFVRTELPTVHPTPKPSLKSRPVLNLVGLPSAAPLGKSTRADTTDEGRRRLQQIAGGGEPESEGFSKDNGLCAETYPDAFFPEKGESTSEAKKVCRECPIRDGCLEYALVNDEKFGVWGGLSLRERNKLKRQRAKELPLLGVKG